MGHAASRRATEQDASDSEREPVNTQVSISEQHAPHMAKEKVTM